MGATVSTASFSRQAGRVYSQRLRGRTENFRRSANPLTGRSPLVTALRTRRTLHLPITLSVVLMVLNISLMILWIVLLAQITWWSICSPA